MTSAVATAVAAIKAKYNNKMLSLQEMIEKSLLLKEFSSTTPPPNLHATPKVLPGGNSLLKTTTKRGNQANLGYFNPYLNKAYEEGGIVSVEKNIYYRNVILFVQQL